MFVCILMLRLYILFLYFFSAGSISLEVVHRITQSPHDDWSLTSVMGIATARESEQALLASLWRVSRKTLSLLLEDA